MTWALIPALLGLGIEAGRATIYWPGDGMCGDTLATGVRFRHSQKHFAHRTLPFRTPGIMCSERTGRCTLTRPMDRGPFGAVRPCEALSASLSGRSSGGSLATRKRSQRSTRRIRWRGRCVYWQAQARLRRGWTYRGVFDLTRPLARAIKHRSFDRVVFFYWR